MSRRSLSASSSSPAPDSRPAKRARTERVLTPDDYRDGIMLAPMVRSGALPTRLYALKHGAKLVWGPEIIDKAILHAKRRVDPTSGTVHFEGVSKAMFSTHPIEKPYLIYQIGTSDPALAVQAAKVVQDDVAGIDLNCGCPKPFSTHAGMGAALLSTPDLLISILEALRASLPERVSLSCKIRLLPDQQDTLKLVERIVRTGINALTVHCRTRNQRMREPATIERLAEIVRFVKALGPDVAVIANGDCQNFEDAKRVRAITEADSVMIATAAESNPTVFSPVPLEDVEKTLTPSYIRLSKHIGNHWSLTKWSIAQFKAPHPFQSKAEYKRAREIISGGKSYDDMLPLLGEQGLEGGERELEEIRRVLDKREHKALVGMAETAFTADVSETQDAPTSADSVSSSSSSSPSSSTGILETTALDDLSTPSVPRANPEPPALSGVPPVLTRVHIPAGVLGRDEPTPTPGGGVVLA